MPLRKWWRRNRRAPGCRQWCGWRDLSPWSRFCCWFLGCGLRRSRFLRRLLNRLAEQRFEVGQIGGRRGLALAKQFAADRPAVAVMFLDQDLGLTGGELEDLRDGLGDGDGEAAALFQRTAAGDMDDGKWHVTLPCRAAL